MPPHRIRCACCLLFTIIAIFISDAHAGAWTQEKGKLQVILNQTLYATDTYYDNQKHERSQPLYRKYELNPYLEYGLADGVTIGANVSLQRVAQDVAAGGVMTNYGIGDSEFFGRVRLLQRDNFVLSAEPLVKLPSPESAASMPKIGASHPDAGLGLAGGYGFGSRSKPHFADLYLGYRYRFGDPRDQIKLAATLGYSLTPRWMVMPQLFLTKRRQGPRMVAFTQSSGDDYDLGKPQLSVVYKLNEKTHVQGGAFLHAAGKNTGAGGGVLLSVWRNF